MSEINLKKFELKGTKYTCIKCKKDALVGDADEFAKSVPVKSINVPLDAGLVCIKYVWCSVCGDRECIEYIKPLQALKPATNRTRNQRNRLKK